DQSGDDPDLEQELKTLPNDLATAAQPLAERHAVTSLERRVELVNQLALLGDGQMAAIGAGELLECRFSLLARQPGQGHRIRASELDQLPPTARAPLQGLEEHALGARILYQNAWLSTVHRRLSVARSSQGATSESAATPCPSA